MFSIRDLIACGLFVELALVTHKPRAASVYATGDVSCAGEFSA